jgi:hypothetical protein
LLHHKLGSKRDSNMEFLKYLPEIKIASSSHRAPNVASVGVADIACGPSAPDDSLMSTDLVT